VSCKLKVAAPDSVSSTTELRRAWTWNFEFMANNVQERAFGVVKKIKKYLWTNGLTVTIPANIKSLAFTITFRD
jgi:hypothetical protein